MIYLLQKYLSINTSHPNPNYREAITLLKNHAVSNDFLSNEFQLSSGNIALVITLQGTESELPSLALNHHMDVVPANNAKEWRFSPFSATIHEGIIYGRGTQDCKGLGICQYAALNRLKNTGIKPRRTIHCIIVPDEERGGFNGTKEFINHPLFSSLNIGYVLDEGMPSGNSGEILIKINERTPLQVLITSNGEQNHASGLLHHNCIHTLIDFLQNISAFTKNQTQRGKQLGDLISMHVTSLSTNNNQLNVIPSRAHATVDIRIPPNLPIDYGINFINKLIEDYPSITCKVLATSTQRCTSVCPNSVLYKTVFDSILSHGLVPKPFIFEATTDSRFYSDKQIQALGLTPFTTKPNLHGTNESISIDDFNQGISILYQIVSSFCL